MRSVHLKFTQVSYSRGTTGVVLHFNQQHVPLTFTTTKCDTMIFVFILKSMSIALS